MSQKLPRSLSYKSVVNALRRLGYQIDRQKGSHIVMYREMDKRRVVVPAHPEIKPGTLKSILKNAKVLLEEFLSVLAVL